MSDSGGTRKSGLDATGATPSGPVDSGGIEGATAAAFPLVEPRELSDAARRALAEAEERRLAYEARAASLPKELGGRGGKEPGRYGDWEVKGIATDF
jgi:hypothetical protein